MKHLRIVVSKDVGHSLASPSGEDVLVKLSRFSIILLLRLQMSGSEDQTGDRSGLYSSATGSQV